MIDGIVVNERGKMYQFERRGETDRLLVRLFRYLAREKQKCWTEHFAAHRQ